MKPLEPKNWPDTLKEIRSFLGKPLNVHSMMAHHTALLKAWMPFRNHVVANSTLSARQRELLILRTAHNSQADYEWQHHVERGLLAGFDPFKASRRPLLPENWLVSSSNCYSFCHPLRIAKL